MTVAGAWISVFVMMGLVVYGQIVLKMRIVAAGEIGQGRGVANYLLQLLVDPWVWSCFVAGFLAALCWMIALSRLSLSTAYPFVALMIAAVMAANTIVLGEPFRLLHLAGIGLIGLGLLMIVQA